VDTDFAVGRWGLKDTQLKLNSWFHFSILSATGFSPPIMVADLRVLGGLGVRCSFSIQQEHLGHSQLSQAERRKILKKVLGQKSVGDFFVRKELNKQQE
jgi:hypothetical protein